MEQIGMDNILFFCLVLVGAINFAFHLGRVYERNKF